MIKYKPVHLLMPLLLLFASWVQADSQYNSMYIFGDSLSDTGNLASVTGNFPPPYYMNRISNGPLAVDVLAAQLGLNADASLHLIGPAIGNNYAVAGAYANGDDIIDLNNQVLMFHANHGYMAPSDALYVILIGGNDIRLARDNPQPATAKTAVIAAAARVRQAIMSLAQSGARSFLVINAPNIGLIPETSLLADALNQPKLIKRARKLSQLYRVALHAAIGDLAHKHHLQITEFDLFKFFNKLLRKADRYGFTNATDACFSSETFSFHPECNFGLNFDAFVFFDEIHPTARVNAIVGEAFYHAVRKKYWVQLSD